jgi:hypothetical protein
MTERENFLERWSRRKTEAQREAEAAGSPAPADAPPRSEDIAKPEPAVTDARHTEPSRPAPTALKAEFDLASLPSLDSITAATDIRPFLSAGVPQELARAALRRAWSADPSVRDFIGLAENQWDFTDPASVPGFGGMAPGTDVKKMIAEIFGEIGRVTEQAGGSDQLPSAPQTTAATPELRGPPTAPPSGASLLTNKAEVQPVRLSAAAAAPGEASEASIVQCNKDAATQQEPSASPPESTPRRRQHGSALPQS